MDLETENRIAAILLKEADELRRKAQQEGVLAYLRRPTVRGRPNSRFLTATVRGVQQANRAVEVNEMWRIRQQELEPVKSRDDSGRHIREEGGREPSASRSKRHDSDPSCSSSKGSYEDHHSRDDEGYKDEEIEKFLHSRVKRGRGSVGSRMDETGPYLPQTCELRDQDDYEGKHRVVLGPEKPSSLKPSKDESESESDIDEWKKRSKKVSSGGSKRKHSRKEHKSKEKSRDKKKKDKRQKH